MHISNGAQWHNFFFSLLNLLRCQVHTEVAKCEEDVNQLQSAISHLSKVRQLLRDFLQTSFSNLFHFVRI